MSTNHLTPAELDALLEAARAATPGPYEARLGSGNNVCTALASVAPDSFDDFVCDVLPDYACKPGIATRWEANRNFIEQANPATITRLVLMVRELQERYKFCNQVQKRGEHSSLTCACVVAVEEVIQRDSIERFRARAVEMALQRAAVATTVEAAIEAAEISQLIESLPLVETEEK